MLQQGSKADNNRMRTGAAEPKWNNNFQDCKSTNWHNRQNLLLNEDKVKKNDTGLMQDVANDKGVCKCFQTFRYTERKNTFESFEAWKLIDHIETNFEVFWRVQR